jgi:hypothetical protein
MCTLCVHSGAIVGRGIRYPYGMAKPAEVPQNRKPATGQGLFREVSYLHGDEVQALVERAKKERTSKAEIIRRALRAYLGVED